MAAKIGLTDNGFAVPQFNEIVDDTKSTLKVVFGDNFNTQTNSFMDKLTTILNDREYQTILLAASVFQAQTMQGAEGIYLDDLLAKRGIYRLGQTKGTGVIQLTVNNTVPYSMIYDRTAYTIDTEFEMVRNTPVAGSVIAQRILNVDWVVGNYTFTIQNMNDRTVKEFKYNLRDKRPNSNDLNSLMGGLKQFIVNNTILTNDPLIQIDSVKGDMWIGYNTSKELVGLTTKVDFRTSPLVGTKTIEVSVKSINPGYIVRDADTVTSISPTPQGFVSMTNLTEFNQGSEIETDNEYKIRAETVTSTAAGKATRAAVRSKLLNEVEGVEKVKIFNNNTGSVNKYGVPAYKFETVVYGGSTEDISQALYDTIALSNNTHGKVFFDISTEDDEVERIYHTKAVSRKVEVRVTYKGRPLSLGEETSIKYSLKNIVDRSNIADPLYNIQLVSAVASSAPAGRFTSLLVEVKDLGAPDTEFTSSDLEAGMAEIFALAEEDVSFIHNL